MSSGTCLIPADPDVSGVGVRYAIYIQNLLSFLPVLWALKDQRISEKELEIVQKQSITILVTAFAVLVSAFVEAATQGLSNFHTVLILSLSWINDGNTFLYFVLYVHHMTYPEPGKKHIEPRWSAWYRHFTQPWRSRDIARDREAHDKDITGVFDIGDTGVQEAADHETKGWFPSTLSFFQPKIVLILGSLHMTVMAALAYWLWLDPDRYPGSSSLACSSTAILGISVPLDDESLVKVSLMVYGTFLVPGINLIIPVFVVLFQYVTGKHDVYDPSETIALPNGQRADIFTGRTAPSVRPIVYCIFIQFVVGAIFVRDIELSLSRARSHQAQGESEWTFGQTLALLLLVLPIRDMLGYLRSCAKDERGKRCTQWLASAVERGDPRTALEAAKHADNIQVHINNEFPSALLYAAVVGDLNLVRLLLKRGANINVQGLIHGTLLIAAVSNSHEQVALYIIQHQQGATLSSADKIGKTALHHTASSGLASVAGKLLEHGAPPDAVDNGGRTPLHLAAARGHRQVVDLFLPRGVRTDGTDFNGLTPFAHATLGGHTFVVDCLKERAA